MELSKKERELQDLYISGHSPFNMHSNGCHLEKNYHNDCLGEKHVHFKNKSEPISVPDCRGCWYLDNYHLSENSNSSLFNKLKQVDRISQKINSVEYDNKSKNLNVSTPYDADYLAKKFFPVTLGKAFELNEQVNDNSTTAPPWSLTFSPPASGWPDPPRPWRMETMHNRNELHKGWHSTQDHLEQNLQFLDHYDDKLKKNEILDSIKTPYQTELAKLRLDRLRLEEEIMMEIKRQEELHRIRGPQPKWYELRDSRFHYEAHKNNKLLRSCENWQDLFNYRNMLTKKSDEFKNKYRGNDYDPTNYTHVTN